MNPIATRWRTAFALVLAAGLAHTQIPPQTVDAVVKQHQDSVLFLSGTVGFLCGYCTSEHQFRVSTTAVVVDARGLILASATGPLADPEVEIRGVTLQVRMPNGTEVPVRVALTDQDLDVMILALDKPEEATGQVWHPLTLEAPAHARVLDPLLVLRRHDHTTGYALSTASVRIHALETRPRRVYFSAGFLGESLSPCFDSSGRLVAVAIGDQSAVSADELSDLVAQAQPRTAD